MPRPCKCRWSARRSRSWASGFHYCEHCGAKLLSKGYYPEADLRTACREGLPRSASQTFRSNHAIGFGEAVSGRVEELVAERNHVVQALTGRPLVVMKDAADQLRRVLQLAAGNAERTRHFLTVHSDVPDDLRAEIDARARINNRVLEYGKATDAALALGQIQHLLQNDD